jgi:hypothetical protein
MVGERLGDPHVMQMRHQTAWREDKGLYTSLLLACHQHTTEAQRIVLALE